MQDVRKLAEHRRLCHWLCLLLIVDVGLSRPAFQSSPSLHQSLLELIPSIASIPDSREDHLFALVKTAIRCSTRMLDLEISYSGT